MSEPFKLKPPLCLFCNNTALRSWNPTMKIHQFTCVSATGQPVHWGNWSQRRWRSDQKVVHITPSEPQAP